MDILGHNGRSCAGGEPKSIDWLWPGYLGRGLLTLLAGDPGVGKSLLALDLAARISTGSGWPASNARAPRGRVLLLASEDDYDHVIIPRLTILGAERGQIAHLSEIEDRMGALPVDLTVHLSWLEGLLTTDPPALVIIDPLHGFLGGVNPNRAEQIRPILTALVRVAERLGFALLAVIHLSKPTDRSALYRLTGSIAQTAAARIVLGVTPDYTGTTRKFLIPLKANLTGLMPSLGFRVFSSLSPAGVPTLDGFLWDPDPLSPRLATRALEAWSHPSLLQRRHRLLTVVGTLQHQAGPGNSILSKDLHRSAKDLGMKVETLCDVLYDLGYGPRQIHGGWVWDPPGRVDDSPIPDWSVDPERPE
jgi:AAA domain